MKNSRLKIRISEGRFTAMGPGKADLLDAIIAHGSISAAAKKMRMSYRRAWDLVNTMNECFQEPLVVTASGGSHGGGSMVTELGLLVLKCYRDLVFKTSVHADQELQGIISHLR